MGPPSDYRRWESPRTHDKRTLLDRAARLGYLAKGVLYCTIGALAFMAAGGSREGRLTGQQGALEAIIAHPLGAGLLVVVALGLAGYSIWQLVRAAVDRDPHGSKGSKVIHRVGYAISGVIHGALAFHAVGLLLGTSAFGYGDSEAKGWIARILAIDPFGRWLIAGAGVALGAFAAREIFKALSDDVAENLDLRRVHPPARHWIRRFGRFGRAARGVVLSLVSVGLVFAAVHANPHEAKTFGDALSTVQSWSFGGVILAMVAIGLVAYGLFEMLEARFSIVRVA